MSALVVNPSPEALRRRNGIMTGRRGSYRMAGYVGSLSVKYMFAGTGSWQTDTRRYQIDRRHFAVLNDGEAYSFEIGAGEAIETFCPFIAPDFFADVVRARCYDDEQLLDQPDHRPPVIEFDSGLRRREARVVPVLERMRRAVGTGLQTVDEFDGLFRELAEALLSLRGLGVQEAERLGGVRPATRQELDRRLRLARDHMHDRLGAPLVLEEIAAVAGLSPHHFHRRFRERFGETPHGYLVARRLERAAELLATTSWSTAEIATVVGFASRTAFSARFRRRYGLAPGRWRQAGAERLSQE